MLRSSRTIPLGPLLPLPLLGSPSSHTFSSSILYHQSRGRLPKSISHVYSNGSNSLLIDLIEKYNLVGKQQWHNLTHSHTLVLQVIGRPSVAHTPERDSKSDSGVDIPKSTPLDISGQQEHLPGGTRAYRLSLKRPLEEFDSPPSPPMGSLTWL
jgi:hypothetical protein